MTSDFDSHRLKRLAAENIVRRTWVEHTNTRFRRTAAIVTSARSFRDATTLGRRYRYLSKRPQYYSCSVFYRKEEATILYWRKCRELKRRSRNRYVAWRRTPESILTHPE